MKIRTFTFVRNLANLKHPIGITAITSISAIGNSSEESWNNYLTKEHFLRQHLFDGKKSWAGFLTQEARNRIEQLKESEEKYANLDDSVLYGIFVARNAVAIAGWNSDETFGINIGSSRGATMLFEKYHKEFINTGMPSTLTSPTTTLGNISSWVAHDLGSKGPEISHSITCSTALHALLNGVAWIRGGLSDRFLVGGSEASLTPFTVAQMKALKIYSNSSSDFPCRSLDMRKKQNTMVLSEGAAMACLEQGITENTLALIEGIGYATEPLEHQVSISTNALCFQRSMKMALGEIKNELIDIIVLHAPGTVKGDMAEIEAINQVFGTHSPALTSNKWKLGHTLGASGMMSIELAILMLQHQKLIEVPYLEYTSDLNSINRVLVNAVGFGGNAVSILLKLPN